uniref:Uncharacterized protein n=1 Tax=Globodera rostochiensis TaxID=31243 RepID=A0A914HWW9_GLORO
MTFKVKKFQGFLKSVVMAQGYGRHSEAEVEEIAKKNLIALSTYWTILMRSPQVHRAHSHIILIFAIIFVEGMIGGECYTFFGKIHRKASPEVKEFSMSGR